MLALFRWTGAKINRRRGWREVYVKFLVELANTQVVSP
jgi:hypothetical protein